MILMNYACGCVLVFLLLSVVILSLVSVPYHGVIALMAVSFFCCIFMVMLGRTFVALVMYVVYLGGLVVVFGYCVSVEKDVVGVSSVSGVKILVFLGVFFVGFCGLLGSGFGWLVYTNLEDLACLEVNGSSVFYFDGGVGLIVCSWGLLVVLFSILVVLGWSRLGGFRPF